MSEGEGEGGGGGEEEGEKENKDGCTHYRRNCKLVAPCCNTAYTCRLCHDFEKHDMNCNYKTKHKLDRFSVKEVVCLECDFLQPVSQNCSNCQTCFGTYFCSICNLFDNTDKGQYHCYKCGFCRVGGQENFIHCDTCNMCISKNTIDTHKCITVKESLCPICMMDMFTSTIKITPLICGHYMHIECLCEYLKSNYKCPLCMQSIVETSKLNLFLDQEIQEIPMPQEYANNKCDILCNDCHEKTSTNFHVVGLKCQGCGGYNTRKI
jgi:RING finger and CHY zinc finger domain-containing protein 1